MKKIRIDGNPELKKAYLDKGYEIYFDSTFIERYNGPFGEYILIEDNEEPIVIEPQPQKMVSDDGESDKKKIKAAIKTFLLVIFVGIVWNLFSGNDSDYKNNETALYSPSATVSVSSTPIPTPRITKTPRPTINQEQKDAETIALLKKTINEIENYDTSNFRNTTNGIELEMIIIEGFSDMASTPHNSTNPEIIELDTKLKETISAFQRKEFPAMRGFYGELLRMKLGNMGMSNDATAETFSADVYGDNKILELRSSIFAEDPILADNLYDIIEDAGTMEQLRFYTVRFRGKEDGRIVRTYDLNKISDSEIIK